MKYGKFKRRQNAWDINWEVGSAHFISISFYQGAAQAWHFFYALSVRSPFLCLFRGHMEVARSHVLSVTIHVTWRSTKGGWREIIIPTEGGMIQLSVSKICYPQAYTVWVQNDGNYLLGSTEWGVVKLYLIDWIRPPTRNRNNSGMNKTKDEYIWKSWNFCKNIQIRLRSVFMCKARAAKWKNALRRTP